jgi:hypothetical protein
MLLPSGQRRRRGFEDMLDAVLMAKHSNRDLVSRTEGPATAAPGGFDVGGVTIGRLLSALADGKHDDQ